MLSVRQTGKLPTATNARRWICAPYTAFRAVNSSAPPSRSRLSGRSSCRTLFDKKEIPKFYSYYYNVKDRLVKDEGSEFGYHMTPDDSYIYLLCHMYKHYLYVGTGLRSLMDIYLFNKRYSDELDMEYISRELEKLELLKFEKNTRSFAEKVFTGQPLLQEEQKELDGF